MFFHRFKLLCDERNISVYKACQELGMNRSSVNKYKQGGKPNAANAAKMAEYFGVTTDYLLEKSDERSPAGDRRVSDADIKFALFGGDGEITDAMYEEVKQFAAFVKQREAGK